MASMAMGMAWAVNRDLARISPRVRFQIYQIARHFEGSAVSTGRQESAFWPLAMAGIAPATSARIDLSAEIPAIFPKALRRDPGGDI
jgi:hypothetical protein